MRVVAGFASRWGTSASGGSDSLGRELGNHVNAPATSFLHSYHRSLRREQGVRRGETPMAATPPRARWAAAEAELAQAAGGGSRACLVTRGTRHRCQHCPPTRHLAHYLPSLSPPAAVPERFRALPNASC